MSLGEAEHGVAGSALMGCVAPEPSAHDTARENLRLECNFFDTSADPETLKGCRPAPRGAFRKSEAELYPESSASLAFLLRVFDPPVAPRSRRVLK